MAIRFIWPFVGPDRLERTILLALRPVTYGSIQSMTQMEAKLHSSLTRTYDTMCIPKTSTDQNFEDFSLQNSAIYHPLDMSTYIFMSQYIYINRVKWFVVPSV